MSRHEDYMKVMREKSKLVRKPTAVTYLIWSTAHHIITRQALSVFMLSLLLQTQVSSTTCKATL